MATSQYNFVSFLSDRFKTEEDLVLVNNLLDDLQGQRDVLDKKVFR
jgi:hypothetical protein